MFILEFSWPQTGGEWLAWLVAFLVVITGFWMLFTPHQWLLRMGLQSISNSPEILTCVRGPIAGTSIGLGLVTLVLHPQPLLYVALGAALFFSTLGRLVSVFIDGGSTKHGWLMLIFEGGMSFSSLAYAFGLIN